MDDYGQYSTGAAVLGVAVGFMIALFLVFLAVGLGSLREALEDE